MIVQTEDGEPHNLMSFRDYVELVDTYMGYEAREYLLEHIRELQEIIEYLKSGGDPEDIDDWEGDAY